MSAHREGAPPVEPELEGVERRGEPQAGAAVGLVDPACEGGIGGEPIITGEGPLRVTASIGFVSFPLGGSVGACLRLQWEQAVNWADMVLYKAKAEGRNRGVGIQAVDASDGDTLAHISHTFTLLPGDLLATGTPAGVGYGRTPPLLLQPGDVVEVDIEDLGVLRNTIVGNDVRRAALTPS